MVQLVGALASLPKQARSKPLNVVCCISDPDTTTILNDVSVSCTLRNGLPCFSSTHPHNHRDGAPPCMWILLILNLAPLQILKTFEGTSGSEVTLDVIEYRSLLAGMVTQIGAEPQVRGVLS